MTLRQYITIMITATLLCWVSWIFVLLNVDPFEDSGVGFIFFYLTLFFSCVGSFSLLGFAIVSRFQREYIPMYKQVKASFFVGTLLSSALVIFLCLHGLGLLQLMNVAIFLGSILFIGLFKWSLRLSNR